MLKIGIIGAGRIGKVHLESICYHVKNATVVAMADPFMNDETESFIRSFGVEKVYKDYKEIINDAEIDAVMVCSSTDTHAPISIEAINAGKHVFCEKPLANTVDKILEIADALKAHPEVKFQVGFNRRFDHNFAAIRKAYDEGKIGDAQILKITSRDPQAPPVGYCAASIFLDMTIHDFDMACFLTNSDVEELYVYADRHTVTVSGEEVPLTYKEFELLLLLISNAGKVMTRDRILSQIWGFEFDGESRTVDVHIRTLRAKLRECGNMIETVRGIGYKFNAGGEKA